VTYLIARKRSCDFKTANENSSEELKVSFIGPRPVDLNFIIPLSFFEDIAYDLEVNFSIRTSPFGLFSTRQFLPKPNVI
jgi:hypothetical protein